MNKLCNDYVNLIRSKYKNVSSIIIYGSNIYNSNSSDLDVCIIVTDIDDDTKTQMIRDTIMFHKENNLKIDVEVPHETKLIYTLDEVKETLLHPPFYKDGKAVITDIVKDRKFLSSNEMKQRLLLNIFTTDHLTIGDSTEEFEKEAWRIMLNAVTEYYNLQSNDVNEILECLYTNRYTKETGEFYLGYKKNYPQKEQYLVRKIKENFGK